MGEYQYIHVSVANRIATLTIDHPPANAFNRQVVEELDAAFDEVTGNDEVKAIIITGAGQFFVAGADINEIYAVKDKEDEAVAFIQRGKDLFDKIEASKKPVIAAINGRFALGGGLELAMARRITLAQRDRREKQQRMSQPQQHHRNSQQWMRQAQAMKRNQLQPSRQADDDLQCDKQQRIHACQL